MYFVPNKEINSCNQKTNNAKFIKCKGATNKLSTSPGENIRKTTKTIMKACKKDWTWKAHSWQTKNIGLIVEFFKLLEFVEKIKGAWFIASQIGVQITKPKPR